VCGGVFASHLESDVKFCGEIYKLLLDLRYWQLLQIEVCGHAQSVACGVALCLLFGSIATTCSLSLEMEVVSASRDGIINMYKLTTRERAFVVSERVPNIVFEAILVVVPRRLPNKPADGGGRGSIGGSGATVVAKMHALWSASRLPGSMNS
jgi:hypothetical protein